MLSNITVWAILKSYRNHDSLLQAIEILLYLSTFEAVNSTVKMVTTRARGTHEASGSSVALLLLNGCTSEVWKYFGFLGKIIETDKSKRTDVCCKL